MMHKGPRSLRISVTDRCQLRCRYCMPFDGVTRNSHEEILTFEETARFAGLVRERFGLTKVRLTGGEPLVRAVIEKLVAMLAAERIPEIALTTNGQLLSERAGVLKRAGLRRVNVRLDSLDPATFRGLTRGGELGKTLAGIEAALAAGLTPVRLNVTVLRGVNDGELVELARFGLRAGCEVRFIELMPIGEATELFPERFVSSADARERIAGTLTLRPAPYRRGESSRNYVARDASGGEGREGVVGFISPCTAPFCSGCRRLRLTPTGRLLGCLARSEGVELMPLLRGTAGAAGAASSAESTALLEEAVRHALDLKQQEHAFAGQRPMVEVGG